MDEMENENWKAAITETHVDYSLMQNMVFDYLVTEGYHEVAQMFQQDVKKSGFKTRLPNIELNEAAKVRKQVPFLDDFSPSFARKILCRSPCQAVFHNPVLVISDIISLFIFRSATRFCRAISRRRNA